MQDTNSFETTSLDIESSSMSRMVADKLKLSNTGDKNATAEDGIDNISEELLDR